MGKLRHRAIKLPCRGCTTGKQWGWNLDPGVWSLEPMLLATEPFELTQDWDGKFWGLSVYCTGIS